MTRYCQSNTVRKELVHYQYSGAVHDVIPGIGMVNLLHYNTKTDQSTPVDYRIYDKETDGKTKNEHFCDMLTLAKKEGSILMP
ncbi:hypothetical protein RHORCCE3_2158 [Rickettsia hoogstraalii str. RCCE3]|nr:hypothetical protein RHORCCE3_2158 [Rickettsia hoogstraalii str. RCCE3]